MKTLFMTAALLGGLSLPAYADDAAAGAPGGDRPDCSELTGKARRLCDKGANDPDSPPPAAISGDRGDCSELEGDAKDMCEKSRAGAASPEVREARDCTGLEGDQLAVCEKMAARAAGEGSPPREDGDNPPPSQEKGGKAMKKSNDGNMESYEDSE